MCKLMDLEDWNEIFKGMTYGFLFGFFSHLKHFQYHIIIGHFNVISN